MYLPVSAACQLVPQAAMLMLEAEQAHRRQSSFRRDRLCPNRERRGPCGVGDGARLLPDFFEHEMLEAALFRLNRSQVMRVMLRWMGLPSKSVSSTPRA